MHIEVGKNLKPPMYAHGHMVWGGGLFSFQSLEKLDLDFLTFDSFTELSILE